MNELALFAGAGGGILGGSLLGWKTVCAVEYEPFCCRRLMQRQNEGHLPPFPIWDDVRTFDGTPWRGIVDVVSGGFPCQDISAAGKGAGITGERSGLWSHMARIIGDVAPRWVMVENSPLLVSRGLTTVLGDLAAMGYVAEWGVLGAVDVGAPHKRDRIWIVCHANGNRKSNGTEHAEMAKLPRNGCDTDGARLAQRESICRDDGEEQPAAIRTDWWESEPAVGRVAHGVANRVDRLRAIGNGQVPAVAASAFRILSGRMRP